MSKRQRESSTGRIRTQLRIGRGRTQTAAPTIGPWWIGTALASAAVAVGSWLVLTALSVAGWLMGSAGSFLDAVGVGGQLWLLIHGAPARFDTVQISLPPLGLTALVLLVLAIVAAGGVKAHPAELGPGRPVRDAVLVTVLGYSIASLGLAFAVGTQAQVWPAALAATLFSSAGAVVGALVVSQLVGRSSIPLWILTIPRSVVVGNLVLLGAGAAGVGIMLVRHRAHVSMLEQGLAAGSGGTVMVTIAEALFLPTFAVWAASFMLGTDVGLGDASIASLTDTHVGLLPGIPIFGAVPANSTGWGAMGWLVVGVLAGVAAAYSHGYRRRHAPIEQLMFTGALVGVATALVFVLIAGISCGNLGVGRLTDLGPALIPLAVMSTSLLGIAGMGTGLVLGLLARR